MLRAALLAASLAVAFAPAAAAHRSASEVRAFKHAHPCPSTGSRRGSCPGYVVDHHVALCVGGVDAASNMRWMATEAAKAKDRWECRPGWQQHLQQCEASRAC